MFAYTPEDPTLDQLFDGSAVILWRVASSFELEN